MRRLLLLCLLALGALPARAEDRVNWEITPRVTAPGQPFRLQIQVESDVVLGGANQVGRDIRPPRGMALRLSGQSVRAHPNEATLNFSGVAPDRPGEYVIPAYNLRFARKLVAVEPIRLIVSKSVAFRRTAPARAELVIPDRTFYVGEKIAGSVVMRGSEQETVTGTFGLECEAEGFNFQTEGSSFTQPLQDGHGLTKTFELTPIRAGQGEFNLRGNMLVKIGRA